VELFDEGHHPWLGTGDLDIWTQTFQVPSGEENVVFPTQVKDGLETYIAVQVAMQFYEGKSGVDQKLEELSREGFITRSVFVNDAIDNISVRRGNLHDLKTNIEQAKFHCIRRSPFAHGRELNKTFIGDIRCGVQSKSIYLVHREFVLGIHHETFGGDIYEMPDGFIRGGIHDQHVVCDALSFQLPAIVGANLFHSHSLSVPIV
jgi:hypothetical protein